MKVQVTASCAQARRQTRTKAIKRHARRLGRAGRACWRSDVWPPEQIKKTFDVVRRHIWMGVPELEAGVLSGEAGFPEVSGFLREPPKYRRSELYVSAVPDGKVTERLD